MFLRRLGAAGGAALCPAHLAAPARAAARLVAVPALTGASALGVPACRPLVSHDMSLLLELRPLPTQAAAAAVAASPFLLWVPPTPSATRCRAAALGCCALASALAQPRAAACVRLPESDPRYLSWEDPRIVACDTPRKGKSGNWYFNMYAFALDGLPSCSLEEIKGALQLGHGSVFALFASKMTPMVHRRPRSGRHVSSCH